MDLALLNSMSSLVEKQGLSYALNIILIVTLVWLVKHIQTRTVPKDLWDEVHSEIAKDTKESLCTIVETQGQIVHTVERLSTVIYERLPGRGGGQNDY